MSLSFISIIHIGYINLMHFSQNGFIYEISCLFTFSLYSVNVFSHVCIQVRKAALVRNYFSTRNNFGLRLPAPLSLSCSAIFDQINTDILFGRVYYLYQAIFMYPIVFLCLDST